MRATDLVEALEALGDLLASRGQEADLAVIGGGALLLQGHIERATKDLDAVALHVDGVLSSARPLPAHLVEAIEDVARAHGLAQDWINDGPTDLLTHGLPAGFLNRATTRSFAALSLRVADRFDQIHFKLYAAVDQGPRSKHMQDLLHLDPSSDELSTAAEWCRSHDPSEAFAQMLEQALQSLGAGDDD